MADSDFDAFVKALEKDPADDGLRLIFADWLEENGSPNRAEYLRVNVERRKLHKECKKCRGEGKSGRHRKIPGAVRTNNYYHYRQYRVEINCTSCKGKGYNPGGEAVLKRESELQLLGLYKGLPPHPEDATLIGLIEAFTENPSLVEAVMEWVPGSASDLAS
jgi:uncharacterized protein (TIGR02996 family)